MHPSLLTCMQSIRPLSIVFVVHFMASTIFFASVAAEGESDAFAPVIPW